MDLRLKVKELERQNAIMRTVTLAVLHRRKSWWRRLFNRHDRILLSKKEFEVAQEFVKKNVTIGLTTDKDSGKVTVRWVGP